jgi:hypothetical protein
MNTWATRQLEQTNRTMLRKSFAVLDLRAGQRRGFLATAVLALL